MGEAGVGRMGKVRMAVSEGGVERCDGMVWYETQAEEEVSGSIEYRECCLGLTEYYGSGYRVCLFVRCCL